MQQTLAGYNCYFQIDFCQPFDPISASCFYTEDFSSWPWILLKAILILPLPLELLYLWDSLLHMQTAE